MGMPPVLHCKVVLEKLMAVDVKWKLHRIRIMSHILYMRILSC